MRHDRRAQRTYVIALSFKAPDPLALPTEDESYRALVNRPRQRSFPSASKPRPQTRLHNRSPSPVPRRSRVRARAPSLSAGHGLDDRVVATGTQSRRPAASADAGSRRGSRSSPSKPRRARLVRLLPQLSSASPFGRHHAMPPGLQPGGPTRDRGFASLGEEATHRLAWPWLDTAFRIPSPPGAGRSGSAGVRPSTRGYSREVMSGNDLSQDRHGRAAMPRAAMAPRPSVLYLHRHDAASIRRARDSARVLH